MRGLPTSPPRAARVDVWLLPVRDWTGPRTPSDAGYSLLDDGERAALARLRVPADRRSYLASHVLLRLALSRAADGLVPPARWRFDRPPHGRPSVALEFRMPRLDFSLSRSSGLAVVAVAHADHDGCRVGVDAERSDQPLCCIPADVALSPAEQGRLARVAPARRPEEFLRLWTLKEAYGKLRGRGVCLPLERVEFDGSSPARLVRTEEGLPPPEELHLESRRIRTGAGVYCMSLAVQCPPGTQARAAFRLLGTLWPGGGEAPRLPADELDSECTAQREAR